MGVCNDFRTNQRDEAPYSEEHEGLVINDDFLELLDAVRESSLRGGNVITEGCNGSVVTRRKGL